MQTYNLTLTEDEAEIVGYALTKVGQNFQRRYDANPKSYRADEIKWKASLVEAVRTRLDYASPNSKAA